MRAAVAAGESARNGVRPVPAYATTAPHAKTSAGGPASRSDSVSKRSGAMYATVPTIWSVRVCRLVASSARAMPKSMTLGVPSEKSTFCGLRSRWITPAPWIAASAVATPTATLCRVPPVSGPCSLITSARLGPSTYSTTRYGVSWSGSASSTAAVQKPGTSRARLTSLRNRPRNSSSQACSGRMTLTATGRPAGVRPR